MIKYVCLDMDGTIADLYGQENWLERLNRFNPSPYRNASALWDMNRLSDILCAFQKKNIKVAIITWLSKKSTPEFSALTRKAKRDWLNAHGIPYDLFFGIPYGECKADCVRSLLEMNEEAILADDDPKARNTWQLGKTIDPTICNLLDELENLV